MQPDTWYRSSCRRKAISRQMLAQQAPCMCEQCQTVKPAACDKPAAQLLQHRQLGANAEAGVPAAATREKPPKHLQSWRAHYFLLAIGWQPMSCMLQNQASKAQNNSIARHKSLTHP